MNIKRLTIKDSNDQESKILLLVYVSWFIGTIKFLIGGSFDQPVMDLISYGTFTAGLIAIMAWRKWIKTQADTKLKEAKLDAVGQGASLEDVNSIAPTKEVKDVPATY